MLKKAFQAWTLRCLVIAMALLYGFSSGAFAQSVTTGSLVIGQPLPLSMECDKRLADGSAYFVEYIAPTRDACFRRDYRRIDTAFGQGEELVAVVLPHPAGAPAPAAMHLLLVDGKVAQLEAPHALVLNGR